jgi:hypothetical protein
MKVVKAYRSSSIISVLLLLCLLLRSTLSQGQNPIENSRKENFIDRILEDSFGFNSSKIAEPANFTSVETGPTTEDPSSDQNDEPIGLPISGSIPEEISVTNTIFLELRDTSSTMNQEQLNSFLTITVGFLSFHLFEGNYFMPSLVEREGIEVVFIRQRRLQEQNDNVTVPLYVLFQVTGMVYEEENALTNDFDQVLETIFVEKEGDYLDALKFVDENYFSSLNEANIVHDLEMDDIKSAGSSEEKDQQPVEDTPTRPFPDIFPEETNDTSGNDRIQGEFLSVGAIVAISISAVVLVAMVAVLIYCVHKKKSIADAKDSKQKAPSQKKRPWNRRGGSNTGLEKQNLLRNHHTTSDKRSDLASNDDLESQAMYSYNQASSGSVYTNGSKLYSNQSHNYGSDGMSYAFSLEPGIEPSVVGSVTTNDRRGIPNNGNDIPIREIPQVSMTTNLDNGSVSHNKMTSSNREEHATNDHFGNIKIEPVPSELELTESELEMLPSNIRTSNDEGDRVQKENEDINGDQSRNKTLTRKILAPAGKLGIVIDTTIEGPKVHSVSKGSQLSGKIFPGDIIVAIDAVDTRAMSASSITAVMVKTASQTRTLTVRGSS